jgi:hypothetical protein
MATIKSTFKRFNGTDWDIHYFETSADLINETASFKVLTASERTLIQDYLNAFNDSDLLVKLDGQGLIPEALIPGGLDYLTVADPTFTGTMTGSTYQSAAGVNLTIQRKGTGGQNTTGAQIVLADTDILFNLAAGQGGQFSYSEDIGNVGYGILDFQGQNQVTGIVNPVDESDAVNKAYVDAVAGTGVTPVEPVEAATTANITLSGTQTIDGVALVADERVLVKNQTTPSENGIYLVKSGAWQKVEADSVKGVLVFIEQGTVNNDRQYYATSVTEWVLFSRVDVITPGNGLNKAGTTLFIPNSGVTNAMLAGDINPNKILDFVADKTAAQEQDWGNGSTGFDLQTHINQTVAFLNGLRGDTATSLTDTLPITLEGAAAKNRTFVVASNPATTGFVSGDIAFQTLT